MGEKLAKPPLTYVLAQVKISPILDMEKKVASLQETIRANFPIEKEKIFRSFTMTSGGSASKIEEIKQWHFLDKPSTTSIALDNSSITIHTNHYHTFAALLTLITDVLTKFDKILNISLCERVGLRYINVIPTNIEQYLCKELLGFTPQLSNKITPAKFLAKIESIHELESGILKVKASHISNGIKNPNMNNLVPPDLMPSAQCLDFSFAKQPQDTFAILDLDHFRQKQQDFKITGIINTLEKLHTIIETVFKKAITKKAIRDWQ